MTMSQSGGNERQDFSCAYDVEIENGGLRATHHSENDAATDSA